ncbi:manganese catalase family protein [Niallia taxi]|nr:manganese catalase family protein [Niallia taxi]
MTIGISYKISLPSQKVHQDIGDIRFLTTQPDNLLCFICEMEIFSFIYIYLNQYLFQACGTKSNDKYREILLDTGTEEIGHVVMLATLLYFTLLGFNNLIKYTI